MTYPILVNRWYTQPVSSPIPGRHVNADRAAELTGLSPNYIRRLALQGKIDTLNYEGIRFIDIDSLKKAIDENRVSPGKPGRKRKPVQVLPDENGK